MIKSYSEKEITKQWIFEALLYLIDQESYEKITITSITQKAGVPRSTFYRYFCEKDDILKEHIEFFYEEFAYEFKVNHLETVRDYVNFHFYFFKKNEKFFRALKKIHKEHIFFDYISDESLYMHFPIEDRYYVLYQAVSFCSIIFSWVIANGPLKEKEMVDLVMSFLSQDTLKKILPIFLKRHQKL